MTQNTLLAQYYTTLHNYCSDQGIPSPAPPIDDVIAQWNSNFKPVQQQIESVNIIARGKAVHAPMHLGDDSATRKGSSLTGLNLRNGIAARRASSQNTLLTTSSQSRTSPGFGGSRSHSFGPSNTSGPLTSQKEYDEAEVDMEPQPYNLHYPQYTTPPYTPGLSSRDEFDRQSTHSSIASSIASKKKPPPPPPKPKRIQSDLGLWVTALYGFDGQEADDLTFREGDRIKVVKKTESTDDWWDGEMAGRRGKFPANYVQLL
jgi:amphiphysin